MFITYFTFIHQFDVVCDAANGIFEWESTAHDASLPVIAYCEVWAQLGRDWPDHLLRQLVDISTSRPKLTTDSTQTTASNQSSLKSATSTNSKIPDRFLDPITFECMYDPVRLPCGQRCDRYTNILAYVMGIE
jgi:hypothetical protein